MTRLRFTFDFRRRRIPFLKFTFIRRVTEFFRFFVHFHTRPLKYIVNIITIIIRKLEIFENISGTETTRNNYDVIEFDTVGSIGVSRCLLSNGETFAFTTIRRKNFQLHRTIGTVFTFCSSLYFLLFFLLTRYGVFFLINIHT